MQPFIEWIDSPNTKFHVKDAWDNDAKKWIGPGTLKLFPHQREILKYVLTLDPNTERFPYTTVIFSTVKKSGKTTVAAAVMDWYANAGPAHSEIYSLANTKEQALARAYEDLCYHVEQTGRPSFQKEIKYPNGTFVRTLPKEYRNIAGARPSLTVYDELWGYQTDEDFRIWTEMTPPPTKPHPLRFVVSYAGFYGESKLLWSLYEQTVLNGEIIPELQHITRDNGDPVCFTNKEHTVFVYWDTVPRMPWQTKAYYAEEISGGMTRNEYLRVHCNQWVTAKEEFIPISMWDKAVAAGKIAGLTAPLTLLPEHPFRTYPISVAADAGVKHDCTAVVGCYYDVARGRVGLAFHKIWTPVKGEDFDLETTLEQYILELSRQFRITSVVYDPTQLHRSMMTLKKEGIPTIEFSQHGKMIAASEHLYELFKNGALEAYESEEMRDHLRFAIAENRGGGNIKLVRGKSVQHKIDAAICLAMSAYDAVYRGGADTRKKTVIDSPFSDFTARGTQQNYSEKDLPEPLRKTPTYKVWSL